MCKQLIWSEFSVNSTYLGCITLDSGCEEPSDPFDPEQCKCDNIALYYTADEAKGNVF